MSAAWPAAAQMTLKDVQVRWSRHYHLEYTQADRYRATRPDGHVLPEADTPEGLDSAIRADWSRRGTR